jgi:EmrB/QacA subfamily drug resistance transporter
MWAIFRDPCDEILIRAAPERSTCSKSQGRWILAATILASSMAFIDGTVVNVALPALQTNLNATAVDVQWVIEAYSLLLSAFLLVGGSLGDHYGRRRIFLIGVIIFAIASAACGFAGTIAQLIGARAVQGFGAALLVPGSLAIISNSFSEQERGPAIGTWSAFSAITAGIGPVFGGWLIEHVSWRAVFFINLPIAVLVILISLRYVAETAERDRDPVDWVGATLAVLGLGALVYGLIESSRFGFGNRMVMCALLAGGLLLILFIVVEWRSSHAMLPLTLFRSRIFTGTNLLTFLLYAALGGTLFFVPLNLIQVQHYAPTAAGAALLPFILIMSLLSRWAGGLVTRYGAKLPLVVGPVIAAAGYALYILPSVGGTYWTTFFPAVIALGLGMTISVAPLTTTVMNSVPRNRVGAASGVNNAVARTAGLVAIAALGIVMLHVFKSSLDRRLNESASPKTVIESVRTQSTKLAAIEIPHDGDPSNHETIRRAIDESFVSGFRTVMLIGATLAAASALTAAVFVGSNRTTTR